MENSYGNSKKKILDKIAPLALELSKEKYSSNVIEKVL